MTKSTKKVLIVCSSGGHLQEALLATQGVNMQKVIATFQLPHLIGLVEASQVYHLTDPHVSLMKYVLNAFQSLLLMIRVRPDAVLTTGAGIAIACALIGKMMGAKLIFVETAARVESLSRTGAFLYRYADLFVVQWPKLLRDYPRAIYGGCVL